METPRDEILMNDQNNVFRNPLDPSTAGSAGNGKEASETVLESRGLHLYYGDTHALKGIDLEVPERQARISCRVHLSVGRFKPRAGACGTPPSTTGIDVGGREPS